MKRQLIHATANLAKQKVKTNRARILARNLLEQYRIKKNSMKALKPYASEGEACLAAERLSAQNAHFEATKIWVAVGMKSKAAQEVKKSGWNPQIVQFCLKHGMEWYMKELMEELAREGKALRASNFAYAIGEKARAIDLGLVHLAIESQTMPNVFIQNEGVLKDIAKKLEEGENYGTAGRIYERINEPRKAASCYIRGGHLDELGRLEGRVDAAMLGKGDRASLRLCREAYVQAVGIGQDEEGWKKKIDNCLSKYTSRELSTRGIVDSAVFVGVLVAAGGTLIALGQVLGALAFFAGAGAMALALAIPLIVRAKAKYALAEAGVKRGTKDKPLQLPAYPRVFAEGEEAKLLQSPESHAAKLEEEGKIYEAGLMYAKMGNGYLARDCGNRLAKEGKLDQARELWILVFGTTYLDMEAREKTEPEAAKAAFISLGIER